MRHRIIIVLFFTLALFRLTANAQDFVKTKEDNDSKKDAKKFTLRSMDGKVQQVHLVPDYFRHILRISCLKDTITDYDFWGVPVETRILNKQFLEIKYAVRGGSGIGAQDIMLLCVSNNKLCESLHAQRLLTGESGDGQENYNIKIVALEGVNNKTYKLIVDVHDARNSKRDPAADYNYNNQTTLSFDTNRNVFYSIKQDLYNSFINMYNPKNHKTFKKPIGGNFPASILGKETYYFIKGGWYQFADNKDLYPYAAGTTK
ncbi:hypothetical protein [Mucilaginibacter gotjawali]|uniref:Uncharacterized protein n=1 Tax=Mucilaginibacter gotjawali TaxID=1550579 RepID=A0A839SJU3_9SPHI|nr:hypothetical protein [Mucilaginibacter gotjawali]MBB3056809.1 hypothetical protein [Mucilaginibacter gotjawali]